MSNTLYTETGGYVIGSFFVHEPHVYGSKDFQPKHKYQLTYLPNKFSGNEVISVRKLDEDEINRLTKEYKNNQQKYDYIKKLKIDFIKMIFYKKEKVNHKITKNDSYLRYLGRL